MKNKRLIFIGSGSLLTNCLRYALPFSGPGTVQCVETEPGKFSNLEKVCMAGGAEYLSFENKAAINGFFENVSEPTLVLSIHNNHIFGKDAIENPALRMVNFHNSLLPKHPGRNAPSWAIYEEETETGVTWHEVVQAIDKGKIIQQSKVSLHAAMTGISLTRSCVAEGFTGFKALLPSLINNDYAVTEQAPGDRKMHYAGDIPNNGFADPAWPAGKLSAFMRALDYGAYPVFPKPKILIDDICHEIGAYRICPAGEIKDNDDHFSTDFSATDNNITIQLTLKKII